MFNDKIKREKLKDKIFVVNDKDETYTYAQMWQCKDRISDILNENVLAVVICHSSIEMLVMVECMMELKVTLLLLDPDMEENIIESYINTFEPGYVVGKKEYIERRCETEFSFGNYAIGRTKYSQYSLPENISVLLTTSGSTGSPKMVALTYDNINSNAEDFATAIGLGNEEVYPVILPLHHAYGLSMFRAHLYVGSTMYITSYKVHDVNLWDNIEKYKCTTLAGVPSFFSFLTVSGYFDKEHGFIKRFIQSGGHLNLDKKKYIVGYAQKKGIQFWSGLGMTETTGIISLLPLHDCQSEKYEGIGKTYSGRRLELSEEDGELIYYGPDIYAGYVSGRSDLRNFIQKHNETGYLTGDICEKDEDGYFYITGRKKRYVKIDEKRIGLDSVQHMLENEFGHIMPCNSKDNTIYVYLGKEAGVEELIIKEFLADTIGLKKKNIDIVPIESVPYTKVGKIDYNKLK